MTMTLSVVRAELFKAFRKRRAFVLAALLWILLPVMLLVLGQVLESNLTGSFVDEAEFVARLVQEIASPFGVARAVLVAPALLSPTLYIIGVALFAGLLVGEEKSHNMWKTVLTAQPNRLAVLAGKFIVAMILIGILMAGGLLSGAVAGAIGMLFLDTTAAGAWWPLAQLYFLQWLFLATATAFAFLLIFLTRNVSLGMVLVFFLPALLEGLYSIFRATVGLQPLNRLNAMFQVLQLQITLETLPRYFFTANLYAPARQPLSDLILLLGGDPSSDMGPLTALLRTDLSMSHSGLVMLGYGALLLGTMAWLFVRRDFD